MSMEPSTARLESGPGCFLARGQAIDCRQRPLIMGIVNVTPDSFYDGGRYGKPEQAVAHALELLEQGADILDVGAESTRPGSQVVPVQDEIDRVIPVVSQLAR